MKLISKIILLQLCSLFIACSSQANSEESKTESHSIKERQSLIVLLDDSNQFSVNIEETGRYQITVFGPADTSTIVWIEDYINNKDERTYNITGSLGLNKEGVGSVDGSPLAVGEHAMMLHYESGNSIDSIQFELLKKHQYTVNSMQQKMDGTNWTLVWSDEFNGEGLVDTSNWSYNIGNWGWGNNEPQYYTNSRTENARQENGSLIIQAHKNDLGNAWTSARLTTQEKTSFLYGKIEFRAKVPEGRGTWAAG